MVSNLFLVYDRAGFFWKIIFASNGPEIMFFWLLKNLVIIFFLICSLLKVYTICSVPAQIPYLEKILFLRYKPKCSELVRLKNLYVSHITLKLAVSQYKIDEIYWFFGCWYKFRKAKSYFNEFWVGMVKNGHGLLVQNECMNFADLLHVDSDAKIDAICHSDLEWNCLEITSLLLCDPLQC